MQYATKGDGHLGLPLLSLDQTNFSRNLSRYSDHLRQQLQGARPQECRSELEQRYGSDSRYLDILSRSVSSRLMRHLVSPEHFFDWATLRVNELGHEQASQEIENFLNSGLFEFWAIVYVNGLYCDGSTKLGEDADVIPLSLVPDDDEKEDILAAHYADYAVARFPMAALRRVISISVHAGDAAWSVMQREFENLETMIWLLNAFDRICCIPGMRKPYMAPCSPPGLFGNLGGSTAVYSLPYENSSIPNSFDASEFLRCYAALQTADVKFRRKILLCLQRLAAAKRESPENMALELGICLEMLLVAENSDGKQLSLSFRSRGAWLMGSDADHRAQLSRLLKDIYDARSKVAHTGVLDAKHSLRFEHIDLACSIVRRIVDRSRVPSFQDWEKLTLGG